MSGFTSSCCLSGRVVLAVKLVMTSFSARSSKYCCLGFSACNHMICQQHMQLHHAQCAPVQTKVCNVCLLAAHLANDFLAAHACRDHDVRKHIMATAPHRLIHQASDGETCRVLQGKAQHLCTLTPTAGWQACLSKKPGECEEATAWPHVACHTQIKLQHKRSVLRSQRSKGCVTWLCI